MDDDERAQMGRVFRCHGSSVIIGAMGPVCITGGPVVSLGRALSTASGTIGEVIHASKLLTRGGTGEVQIFIRIDPAKGYLSGVTCDARAMSGWGCGAGGARGFTIQTGAIDIEAGMPAVNITKVALSCEDEGTALVTSTRIRPNPDAPAVKPAAAASPSFG